MGVTSPRRMKWKGPLVIKSRPGRVPAAALFVKPSDRYTEACGARNNHCSAHAANNKADHILHSFSRG